APSPQRGQRQRSAAPSSEAGGRESSRVTPDTSASFDGRAGAAPPIDADEEEQPDDVDEVPVPCRRLEAEMMVRLEMAGDGAEQVHGEEARADDDMEAVETRRHEEGRGVNASGEAERGVAVFPGLQAGEADAEDHRHQ